MPDEIKLDIKVTIPLSVEASADMPDKWANGLTNNAELINDRRKAAIPDEGTFQSKVAVPSSIGFSPMVAAAFVSRSGRNQANIIRAQQKNLGGSFNHWNDKLDLAFDTVGGVAAKRFKDQVNNSKDFWATEVAAKTLRGTGDKIRGLLLPQVGFWMTGDVKAHQMANALTIVDGAPYDFTWPGFVELFKAAAMPLLMSSLARILDSDILAAEVTAQNTTLLQFANTSRNVVGAPVKPFVVGGGALDSLYQWEHTDPQLDFHARVVLV